MHISLENNVATQRNGIVAIIVNTLMSPSNLTTNRYNQKINRIVWRDAQEALPMRVMSAHTYIKSSITQSMVVDNMMFAIGRHLRARYCHYNIYSDFLVALGEHGVDESALPAELDGTLDFNYEDWLDQERRRAAENEVE